MRSAAGSAGVGALLLLVAGTFDAEPVYVAGAGLVVLAVVAVGWSLLAARGARVTRRLDADRVVEGEPLGVRLEGLTALPAPGGLLRDPLLDEPATLPLGGRRASVRMNVRFARRGLRELAPATLEVGDPLGLVRRPAAVGAPARVLVLPRIEDVVAAPLGGSERPAPVGLVHGAAETDFDGLRPYRDGAPAARIHWPALARGAGLLERRLVADGDHRPLVVLDGRDPAHEDDLDAAVRAAASLTRALAVGGGSAALLPGERRPTTLDDNLAGWPDLHARFALAGARAAVIGPGHARRGAIFYVAARRAARLPRPLADHRGAVVLVVPGELPGRRAAFAVAGCCGYVEPRRRLAA